MFANQINEATGNPICVCGQDCEPNTPDGSSNDVVMGTKGLVILHRACIEEHNTRVQMGLV